MKEDNLRCLTCGSRIGVDCGEAEPDYNLYFCSHGCANRFVQPCDEWSRWHEAREPETSEPVSLLDEVIDALASVYGTGQR